MSSVEQQNAEVCRIVADACQAAAAGREIDRAALDQPFRYVIGLSHRQTEGSLEFLRCYYNALDLLEPKLTQFNGWSLETIFNLMMSGNKFSPPSPPTTAITLAAIILHSIANHLEDLDADKNTVPELPNRDDQENPQDGLDPAGQTD